MKVNIKNETNIPFEKIGKELDNNLEPGIKIIIYKREQYKMATLKNKTSIHIEIDKLNIEAPKVSKKGLVFPRLPYKLKKN
jgi:hypothetical protein